MAERETDGRSGDWFVDSFGEDYLTLYRHRDRAEAGTAVAFAAERLALRPEHAILDLCCGGGRHLAALEARGLRAVGLDLSPVLLCEARALGLRAPLVRADMRRHPFLPRRFDVVLSFFTSFGYFADDVENRTVLDECGRVLREGGYLLLDYLNRDYVLNHGLGDSRDRRAGFTIIQSRRWNREADTVDKTIRIVPDGEPERVYHESVRLYAPARITEMIEAAGFEVVDAFGSLSGDDAAPEAPRFVTIARR